jgi:DNA-binding response OmpR family regulator
VTTLLTHAGHETFEAADGRAGLSIALEIEPDLLITDLGLPQMSGTELIRALRADPRTQTTRIALYTATTIDAATRDFMEIYGVVSALPKPSEPRELLAAIESALHVQRHF